MSVRPFRNRRRTLAWPGAAVVAAGAALPLAGSALLTGTLWLAGTLWGPSTAHAQAGAEAALITLQSTQSAMGARRVGERFRLPEIPVAGGAARGSSAPGGVSLRGGGAREVALPPRPRSGAPGAVSGRLVDESGVPIEGIPIGLLSMDARYAPEYLEVVSDSAGVFRFQKVEPGPWMVRFDPAKLPARYAPRRAVVDLTLARSEHKQLADLTFLPGACTAGTVAWSDGPPALETEIFFAPADTSFYSIVGRVDGEGRYRLCGIPAGRVHAWSDLGDGRWLGRPMELAPGSEVPFDLSADPSSRLRGSSVWFDARTEDGRAIAYAEIVVLGRSAAADGVSRLVYLRGAVADRGGAAEFLLPHGEYEVLAMNPREGEWTRISGLVIDDSSRPQIDKELVLVGSSREAQRVSWVDAMRERAERALYVWASPGDQP